MVSDAGKKVIGQPIYVPGLPHALKVPLRNLAFPVRHVVRAVVAREAQRDLPAANTSAAIVLRRPAEQLAEHERDGRLAHEVKDGWRRRMGLRLQGVDVPAAAELMVDRRKRGADDLCWYESIKLRIAVGLEGRAEGGRQLVTRTAASSAFCCSLRLAAAAREA